MDPKPRPNHALYIEVLRRMTPEQKLQKMFELSAFTKELFRQGLRQRFPELSEEEFHRLYLERLAKCQPELLAKVVRRPRWIRYWLATNGRGGKRRSGTSFTNKGSKSIPRASLAKSTSTLS